MMLLRASYLSRENDTDGASSLLLARLHRTPAMGL